jgi:threonylcarbamoyladenosine tRNA methylthiotransferase MtaB
VKQRVSDGYQEVVLTGTEIGSYHHNGLDLKGLLELILVEAPVTRLRLSSLQPREITPGLVGLWQNQQFCRHFHLSLQSGSNGVLARMKRGYSTGDYQQAVTTIRELLPEAAITTDIITGFPGETEEEFTRSLAFCRQVGFARIHVFPYSLRPETPAACLSGQIDSRVKQERSREMLALAEEGARSFRRQFMGKRVAVLWEKQTGSVWSSLTDNYIRVYTKSSDDLTNKLLPVKLTDIWKDGVWGV